MADPLRVRYRRVGELHEYYRNPRRGVVASIVESLRESGQYKPIVVNIGTVTGRPDEVLVGNHTLQAARELGWEWIATVDRDLNDEQAARVVTADNRTADLGTYDDAVLLEVLGDLDSLDGTGYAPSDVEDLERALSGSGSPGSGGKLDPPDDDQVASQYAVIVTCEDEVDQQRTFEQLRDQGLTVKVVSV